MEVEDAGLHGVAAVFAAECECVELFPVVAFWRGHCILYEEIHTFKFFV